MNRYIADENFPYPSFALLTSRGIDIIHVGLDSPSISDRKVIEAAYTQQRLLLTLDRDHGELIFTGQIQLPPGVIYFRLPQYRPTSPGEVLLDLISSKLKFEGFFTVITPYGVRQRSL